MLAGLAWRNIWRQPQRSVLSLCSIALAGTVTIFLLALQEGSYDTIKENVLRLMDGFAQVQPGGYADAPDLRKTIADPAALMARLEAVPGVTASAPRAQTFVILSNGPRSYAAAVLGVEPARERALSTLGQTVSDGAYLRAGDGNATVVGAALARNLKLRVGGTLTMLGSASDGSVAADVLRVKGIFSTGVPEIDRQLIEMPLKRFQTDFNMAGRVNVIAVAGRRLANIQASLPALRTIAKTRGLVVRNWSDLEPAMADAILLDISISLLFYFSLVTVVVFIILNTLLMSVLERTREFGMLMAIGMRPGQIGVMIWQELLFLSVTGAALAVACGSALTLWVTQNGLTFAGAEALFAQFHMPATLYPRLDFTSALTGPLAIVLAIAVAGIVPYMRVRSLKPVSAMREA